MVLEGPYASPCQMVSLQILNTKLIWNNYTPMDVNEHSHLAKPYFLYTVVRITKSIYWNAKYGKNIKHRKQDFI